LPSDDGSAPAPVTLAVMRQQQIYALAVVTGTGAEWSLLLSPAFRARGQHPRPGDLVAVQHGEVVAYWPRALVLRTTPAGVHLRLSSGAQIVAPVNPATLPPDPPLQTGDAVFAGPDAVLARAWAWYEPQPPTPALLAYATAYVTSFEF